MLTPEQKVKHLILNVIAQWANQPAPEATPDNIDILFADDANADAIQDAKSEIRQGEVETGLPCEYSRHYESKSVAAKASDGSWVGWTYWYGGGKHGEPEAIDWIEGAYDLSCFEEERLVTVRTFSKAG